ncbi:hypothetical protein LWI28_003728 [Acer negundo]|uniref:Uncharacterized protein n=1 Tax=Acer negundo TaxID=4023 RepID=A0AAD5JC77_ACENE|nr:hypothetical protein LWI28_003728 [Acer negundo]KAK4854680.1 hypothetical protein QYF36_000154 [Acer negundo]
MDLSIGAQITLASLILKAPLHYTLFDEGDTDVWTIIESEGNKKRWTKKISIPHFEELPSFQYLAPVCFTKNGESPCEYQDIEEGDVDNIR